MLKLVRVRIRGAAPFDAEIVVGDLVVLVIECVFTGTTQ